MKIASKKWKRQIYVLKVTNAAHELEMYLSKSGAGSSQGLQFDATVVLVGHIDKEWIMQFLAAHFYDDGYIAVTLAYWDRWDAHSCRCILYLVAGIKTAIKIDKHIFLKEIKR